MSIAWANRFATKLVRGGEVAAAGQDHRCIAAVLGVSLLEMGSRTPAAYKLPTGAHADPAGLQGEP